MLGCHSRSSSGARRSVSAGMTRSRHRQAPRNEIRDVLVMRAQHAGTFFSLPPLWRTAEHLVGEPRFAGQHHLHRDDKRHPPNAGVAEGQPRQKSASVNASGRARGAFADNPSSTPVPSLGHGPERHRAMGSCCAPRRRVVRPDANLRSGRSHRPASADG